MESIMFLPSLDQAQVALRAQLNATISPSNDSDPERAFVVVIPRTGTNLPLLAFGPTPEVAVNNAYRGANLAPDYVELR